MYRRTVRSSPLRRWLSLGSLLCGLLPTALHGGANAEDAQALYLTGKQAYLNQDYEQAHAILEPLARAGKYEAQIFVAVMYDHGYGVEANPEIAFDWYKLAAEQGVPEAQHDLGIKYFKGSGVAQDVDQTLFWWQKAAGSGYGESQFNLGVYYFHGHDGTVEDLTKALKWFTLAAEQGHPDAQYSLGVMHAFGRGVPQDYAQALELFKKAAAQGVPKAKFNIGVLYENGHGVEKDLAEAEKWFQEAAAQGLPEAKASLRGQHFADASSSADPAQHATTDTTQKNQTAETKTAQKTPSTVQRAAAETTQKNQTAETKTTQKTPGTAQRTTAETTQKNQTAETKTTQQTPGTAQRAAAETTQKNQTAKTKTTQQTPGTAQRAAAETTQKNQTAETKKIQQTPGLIPPRPQRAGGAGMANGPAASTAAPLSVAGKDHNAPRPIRRRGKSADQGTASKPPAATAMPPPATVAQQPAPHDAEDDRYDKTAWLQQQEPSRFTIQINSVGKKQQAIRYILGNGLSEGAGYVKVFIGNAPRYNTIFGLYSDRNQASAAVQQLPSAVRDDKPWVRNIGQLQSIVQQ